MFFFDRGTLRARGKAQRAAFESAAPFPHAAFDDFVGADLARELARAFPGPEHEGWMRRDYREQAARLGQLQRTGFAGVAPVVRALLNELCGMAFLDFLSALTGIEGIIADPHFRGAGPSLTLRGGHLALHADFNRDRTRHLERKLTVVYYLCPNWDPAWRGALELWDHERTQCVSRIDVGADRLVVLAHGDTYWHGHPAPLACPDDRHRASIASYYYVAAPSDADREAHGAIWA